MPDRAENDFAIMCCCARVVPLRIVNNKLLAEVPADFDNRIIHCLREGFLAVCNSVLRHHWSSFRPCNPLTRRSQCPSAPNGLHQWFTLSKYTFSAHWPT